MINALSLLLGQPPNALRNELATAKAIPPVPPRVPVGLPSELARRRPDIRQAEAQLHAATADIGVAQANFYPSLNLTGSFGLQSLQFGKVFNLNSKQYAVGPGLTIPIFQGGQLRSTLQLRQAQQQEAAINFQRTVLQAWHDVDNALTAYQTEQSRRDELDPGGGGKPEGSCAGTKPLPTRRCRLPDRPGCRKQPAWRRSSNSPAARQTVSSNLVALYKALGGGWETDMPDGQKTATK